MIEGPPRGEPLGQAAQQGSYGSMDLSRRFCPIPKGSEGRRSSVRDEPGVPDSGSTDGDSHPGEWASHCTVPELDRWRGSRMDLEAQLSAIEREGYGLVYALILFLSFSPGGRSRPGS